MSLTLPITPRKMIKPLFTILSVLAALSGYSQNLFSEQFDDCHQSNLWEQFKSKTTENSRIPSMTGYFKLYDTKNSPVPWDMSRAITIDHDKVIWYGTDNGIVKIRNNSGVRLSKLRLCPSREYQTRLCTNIHPRAQNGRSNHPHTSPAASADLRILITGRAHRLW